MSAFSKKPMMNCHVKFFLYFAPADCLVIVKDHVSYTRGAALSEVSTRVHINMCHPFSCPSPFSSPSPSPPLLPSLSFSPV